MNTPRLSAGARLCMVAMVSIVTAWSGPGRAMGAEKLAVVVLGTSERDAELANNLTEIIIAWIAQRRGAVMAGREEFRARLGVENEQRSQACIDDIPCLGRAAVSLGVRQIVAGNVGMRGKQYLFNLNLIDVEAGKVDNHLFRLVEGGVEDLIKAVQNGTEELFRPRVEPGRVQINSDPPGARVAIDNAYLGVTPLISGTLLPGKHRVRVEADGRFPWNSSVDVLPGQDLGVNLTTANLPKRRVWPHRAAVTTATLGAVALAAGGFFGAISQLSPSGETGVALQDDFDKKQRFATAANVSFITGGALLLTSLVMVIAYHDDVFGRDESAPSAR